MFSVLARSHKMLVTNMISYARALPRRPNMRSVKFRSVHVLYPIPPAKSTDLESRKSEIRANQKPTDEFLERIHPLRQSLEGDQLTLLAFLVVRCNSICAEYCREVLGLVDTRRTASELDLIAQLYGFRVFVDPVAKTIHLTELV